MNPPDLAELERLLGEAKPLLDCDHRCDRPNPRVPLERERIIGFVVDENDAVLANLNALVMLARMVPTLIECAKAVREIDRMPYYEKPVRPEWVDGLADRYNKALGLAASALGGSHGQG